MNYKREMNDVFYALVMFAVFAVVIANVAAGFLDVSKEQVVFSNTPELHEQERQADRGYPELTVL